jgi:hypothetical protein
MAITLKRGRVHAGQGVLGGRAAALLFGAVTGSPVGARL